MPTEIQTRASGADFDGTTTTSGEFVLTKLKSGDDTQRPELFTVSVQCTLQMSSIIVRAAATLADATGTGITFIELINVIDAIGAQKTCCRCILPNDWKVFVITTGAVAAEKKALVDWQGVTKRPQV